MTSYSALGPSDMRPLLMSSLVCDVERININVFASQESGGEVIPPASKSKIVAKTSTTALAKPIKPWPYTLPTFLRPQAGTTYEIQYGAALDLQKQERKRIGGLQAIFYGRPDPDEKGLSPLKQDGILHKVLYGVKEVDGQELKVTAEMKFYGVKEDVEGKTVLVEAEGCTMIAN